jgi:hypothetical protein
MYAQLSFSMFNHLTLIYSVWRVSLFSSLYTVNTDIWFKHSFPDAGVQTRDESGSGQNHKSGF